MKRLLWLDARDALTLHDRLLVLHGGAAGVRDHDLLASALARPEQHADYTKAPNMTFLAALYTAGIVRNHPFVDGNKRTGFVLGVLFLELNGFIFQAREDDAAQAVMALAAGAMDEASYADFLNANVKRRRKAT